MFSRRTTRTRTRDRSPRAVLVRQIAGGSAVLLFVALLGALVWYATRINTLTIQTIAVSGGETIPHDMVRNAAEKHLFGSYFILIPHRFAWFYPKEAIRDAVASIDRVEDVTVARTSGTELSIEFSEHEPAGLWCANNAQCVFVDEHGFAFARAPSLTGAAILRYHDPARTPAVGAVAYSAEDGARFRATRAALKEKYGLALVSVEQIVPGEVAYRVAEGGVLKVAMSMPQATVLENLDTIFSSVEFAHLTDGTFAYIDLRYGEKVFVREHAVNENAASSTDAAE